MKIIVISDTHGHIEKLEDALETEGQPDAIIHCGDICGDEERLKQLAGCPCYMVGGNMDFTWGLPEYALVEAEGHTIFAAHGHRLGVNFDTSELAAEAAAAGADIAAYGHTHVPEYHTSAGMLILNPGSLSYPRQADRRPSYAVLTLEAGEEPKCELKYLGKYL